MCGIVGSFNTTKLNELGELNKSRGNKAYSLSTIGKDIDIKRFLTPFEAVGANSKKYKILHIQSPTKLTNLEEKDTHPFKFFGDYLFHNGMLLDSSIKALQTEMSETTNWDTELLLKWIIYNDYDLDCLNDLKGSFACILVQDKNIYCFRNKISPLFYDKDLNISSIKFENSISLPSNIIFRLDLKNKVLKEIREFNCIYNPYNFD